MQNLENKKYWVWLSLIPNLGSKRKQKLLEIYKNPQGIYNANEKELMQISGIGESLAKNIVNTNIKHHVPKHLEYMQKNNIDIISIIDNEYPEMLKQIYDFPISLYIKGNKEILNNKSVAIVGCRQASEYGKKSAKYFAYNLAMEGINIISGLAIGIDSYSHIGAICANNDVNMENKGRVGKTIAVVGSGVDTVYPRENEYLQNKIIETGGSIISEYPLGTKPEKMNFPARNRIISGLSKSIVVIEAKEKSGTLITVDFALEQGRDVFVVPGNINSINSVGTNDLIKQGAKVATNYRDLFGDAVNT